MMTVDLMGWLAATLTLLTFVCSDMRRLRVLAICANVAFVAYGASAGLMPVLALHLMLAPVNIWRLRELHKPCPSEAEDADAAVPARAPR
jgi:hypothetical protein